MPETFSSTEHGAATIVSGISSMRGVALGVSLRSKATVSVSEGEGARITIRSKEDVDDRLISECVSIARRECGLRGHVDVCVESQIPPSRGMKSSSSVSLAVLGALARASGSILSDRSLLNMSARASIAAGVSVTGAFDDAAACHHGGLVFANNARMTMTRHLPVGRGFNAVFCIPRRRIPKHSLPLQALKERAGEMLRAYRLALSGRFREACAANTMALCGALDIDPAPSDAAMGAGAALSGLTGTGPAFFAVCRRSAVDRVSLAMGQHGETVRSGLTGVKDDGLKF